MNRKISAIAVILALIIASTAASTSFARGYGHGHHGNYGHSYRYNHHGHDGLGIALGVAGGLLLGSVFLHSLQAPPRGVVYVPGYPAYRQPRICLEKRFITGEWRVNRYDGRRFWVPYRYPETRMVRIPCH